MTDRRDLVSAIGDLRTTLDAVRAERDAVRREVDNLHRQIATTKAHYQRRCENLARMRDRYREERDVALAGLSSGDTPTSPEVIEQAMRPVTNLTEETDRA
ncbi:hypothetical protein [Amycolatopsis palatopharyngis]|uniref:hypothetical protein n=1 Tax=Amycolatopsis palatopharyngis TaxID=187982 RepID=UPI000E24C89B|nr:hypothetical protein [Amycolatopsis palatopharyngis]